MYVIGLTGGIATGKSTAAQVLRELGARIIDADEISRASTKPGGAAAEAVLRMFGTLDRRELGKIVFADERKRLELEEIVHPIVISEVRTQLMNMGDTLAVLDVPLLFESGMDAMADEIWVTAVSQEEQVRRICERDGLNEKAALARIHAQMSTEEKIRRADCVIDTSGPQTQTRVRIEQLWCEARKHAEKCHG